MQSSSYGQSPSGVRADLNAVDFDKRTVLHLAADFGSKEIVNELSPVVTCLGARTLSASAVKTEGKNAREKH